MATHPDGIMLTNSHPVNGAKACVAVTGNDVLLRLLDAQRIGKGCVLRLLRAGQLLHLPVTPVEVRN